ncbi:MAG: hypothetical protein ACUZ77_11110 [Candidatus Brocadiales bacterium]
MTGEEVVAYYLLPKAAGKDYHKQVADFVAVWVSVDNNIGEYIEDSNEDNNTKNHMDYRVVDSNTRMDSKTHNNRRSRSRKSPNGLRRGDHRDVHRPGGVLRPDDVHRRVLLRPDDGHHHGYRHDVHRRGGHLFLMLFAVLLMQNMRQLQLTKRLIKLSFSFSVIIYG